MLTAGLFLISLAAGLFITGAVVKYVMPRFADVLERQNYAGRKVYTSYGVLLPIPMLAVYVVLRPTVSAGKPYFGVMEGFLVLILVMCGLGLLDDVKGDRSARGFKGHFKEAFRGHITTGFVKAAGGLAVSLLAAWPISDNIWELITGGLLIALVTNLFNLLDMRPGRAIKVFLPLLGLVLALNHSGGRTFVAMAGAIGVAALILLPGDLSERFMLGDAGSNVLGAAVGFGLAMAANVWWRLGLLVFFALLNLLSEKYSFTRVIESNAALRYFDSLGRKGTRGPVAN